MGKSSSASSHTLCTGTFQEENIRLQNKIGGGAISIFPTLAPSKFYVVPTYKHTKFVL